MKEFVFDAKPMKLSAYLGKVCPEISYTYLRTLLRMREVKINGKRVNEDIKLFPGDSIQIYAQEGKLFRFVPMCFTRTRIFVFSINREESRVKITRKK